MTIPTAVQPSEGVQFNTGPALSNTIGNKHHH
jgi:hypothetical protein